MVVPVGFEPTAFHLGGERSILLSYGTIQFWIVGFGDWIVKTGPRSGIVPDQRFDPMAVKFVSAVEKI